MTTKSNLMTAGFAVASLPDPKSLTIDQMDEFTSYVPYLTRLADAAYAFLDQHDLQPPGVFDYEVSPAFADWWDSQEPIQVHMRLQQLVHEFMELPKDSPISTELWQVLLAVPTSTEPPKLGTMPTNKTRQIIEPSGGWKEQTYYVVDVCYSSGNPIHRAILYVGFLGHKDPLSGGYTCLMNATYDNEITKAHTAWYLRPISIIEDL